SRPGSASPPSPQGGGMSANDDLLSIVNRVHALSAFLATEDGTNLLAGTKRAVNFLVAEEKKDGAGAFEAEPDAGVLTAPQEGAMLKALQAAQADAAAALSTADYTAAMAAMARLRGPVDAFLDGTLVNDPDPAIRLNRLRLLAALRRVTSAVADFSKVAG
ncbi:MAG: glycine--tRNA ligase subunit beta, partial [Beijerinckiaceae bacterium]